MKKNIIITSSIILILLGSAFIYFLYYVGDLKIPFGNNVTVKNYKYGFEFSYPRKRGLNNVHKQDIGLPGDNRGTIYSYSALSGSSYPFRDKLHFYIYNLSIEEYFSEFKVREHGYKIIDINKFNKNGKKVVTDVEEMNRLGRSGYYTYICYILFEHKNLLYDIDCGIENFKFL